MRLKRKLRLSGQAKELCRVFLMNLYFKTVLDKASHHISLSLYPLLITMINLCVAPSLLNLSFHHRHQLHQPQLILLCFPFFTELVISSSSSATPASTPAASIRLLAIISGILAKSAGNQITLSVFDIYFHSSN